MGETTAADRAKYTKTTPCGQLDFRTLECTCENKGENKGKGCLYRRARKHVLSGFDARIESSSAKKCSAKEKVAAVAIIKSEYNIYLAARKKATCKKNPA